MELTKENYLKLRDAKNHTRPQMAGVFGISDWKLKKWIASNSLSRSKPVLLNKRVFSTNTPESLYWAGFLAADGNVDSKGRVRIYLQLSDVEHLRKFAKFVGSSHAINENATRNRCSIEFTCKEMVGDLQKFGIVPNKSITYCPPYDEALLYSPDFLRGYFDGDGGICERFSNSNSTTSTVNAHIAMSKYMLDWVDLILTDILNITYSVSTRDNHVQIQTSTLKSEILCNYLYKDSTVELDRKMELYTKIFVNKIRKTR